MQMVLYAHPSPWSLAARWHTCKYTTASCMNLTTVAIYLPPSNAYAIYSLPLQWLTMNMASYACNLNLIKVIMLCCDCCRNTPSYATYRHYTIKYTCTTEASQPPACYQCHMQPHATPNCKVATLHEVPRHSICATLPYIMHRSPSTCWMVAQLLMVMHPASTTALQRLGCVNTYHRIGCAYLLYIIWITFNSALLTLQLWLQW